MHNLYCKTKSLCLGTATFYTTPPPKKKKPSQKNKNKTKQTKNKTKKQIPSVIRVG